VTPLQVAAWAVLGFARKRGEAAEALMIATMGVREKPETINKLMKEWGDG